MYRTSKLAHWFTVLAFCVLIPFGAYAHEIKPSIIELDYASSVAGEKELDIKFVLNLESLISEIGSEHDDTDDSENRDAYDALRVLSEDELSKEFDSFRDKFIDGIELTDAEGERYQLDLKSIKIPIVGDIKLPRDTIITLSTRATNESFATRFQWLDEFGMAIVRASSDEQPLDYAALLSPGQASDLITYTQPTVQSAVQIFTNYIVVGFEHIVPKGLDHILFVIGLFLLSPAWRPLALQVTTFTIAHSITLALGATDVLRIPASIVEPLIALSIVFVCVENFLSDKLNKWRVATVFVFGLLHGLGFASVLDEVGISSSHFITALFGFNVGVEIGQLLIVLICMLLIGIWAGRKPWYRNGFSKPASLVIGLIGAYWFIQRIGIGGI